jgi:uncharacterized SAM-binding protein YcdF (DUF218 family)
MYRFIVELLQPHTLLSLWACWALFRRWRRREDPRRRWWPLFVPLLALAAVSTPAVSYLALRSLESYAPPLDQRPADVPAIVVFSAGVYPPEGPRTRPELDEDTLHRCLAAARLYHQGSPCLVVVSGGKVEREEPGPPYAAVMAEFLEQLGVRASDLVREEASRTTYENAVESARLLRERHLDRVVLVVDAQDMPRAALCLRKTGIEVVPAPCHFRATGLDLTVFNWLPSPSGARGMQRAWHEWLGLLWYWCRGRI